MYYLVSVQNSVWDKEDENIWASVTISLMNFAHKQKSLAEVVHSVPFSKIKFYPSPMLFSFVYTSSSVIAFNTIAVWGFIGLSQTMITMLFLHLPRLSLNGLYSYQAVDFISLKHYGRGFQTFLVGDPWTRLKTLRPSKCKKYQAKPIIFVLFAV